MGLIAGLLGLGSTARQVGAAVSGVAEVFVGNRTERAAQDHAAYVASLSQFGAEFAPARMGWFDRLVDGLNRLPRPALAMGTLGLFVYAMAEPVGFSVRMQGLQLVPDPLWWLLGAIVSFYFGARELHHFRGTQMRNPTEDLSRVMGNIAAIEGSRAGPDLQPPSVSDNPAITAWRQTRQ